MIGNVDEYITDEAVSGGWWPEPVLGTEAVLPADAVAIAFGFRPSPPDWFAEHDIALQRTGGGSPSRPNRGVTLSDKKLP